MDVSALLAFLPEFGISAPFVHLGGEKIAAAYRFGQKQPDIRAIGFKIFTEHGEHTVYGLFDASAEAFQQILGRQPADAEQPLVPGEAVCGGIPEGMILCRVGKACKIRIPAEDRLAADSQRGGVISGLTPCHIPRQSAARAACLFFEKGEFPGCVRSKQFLEGLPRDILGRKAQQSGKAPAAGDDSSLVVLGGQKTRKVHAQIAGPADIAFRRKIRLPEFQQGFTEAFAGAQKTQGRGHVGLSGNGQGCGQPCSRRLSLRRIRIIIRQGRPLSGEKPCRA